MRMEQVVFTEFALSDGGRYALKTVNNDALTATSNQNCRCVDGKLFLGLGLKCLKDASGKEMATGQTVRTVIPASYWQNNTEHQCPVIVTAQGKLYQYNESTGAWTEIPATVAGNVGACFAIASNGNSGAFIVSNNGFLQTGTAGGVIQTRAETANGGVCVFKDRVFYSAGNTVVFSDAGNYLDFVESACGGGRIEIWEGGGRVWQLLPFDGAILLIKEQSVLKMYAAGAADEFRIEKLDFCAGRIAKGSAAVCGKYVMFVTVDGNVYRFNGSSFEKIAMGIPKEYCQDFKGTASDGVRYFRAGEMLTLVMEADGSCYTSYSIDGLTGCGDMAVGVYGGKVCCFDPTENLPLAENATFVVSPFVLQDEKEKIVRKVTVYGTGNASVCLSGERGELYSDVALDEDGVAFETEIWGQKFVLKLGLATACRLDKIVFEYTAVEKEN